MSLFLNLCAYQNTKLKLNLFLIKFKAESFNSCGII